MAGGHFNQASLNYRLNQKTFPKLLWHPFAHYQEWRKPRHLRTRWPRSGLTLRLMFACHLEEARNDRLRIVAQRDAAPMPPFADTRRETKRTMVGDDYDEI